MLPARHGASPRAGLFFFPPVVADALPRRAIAFVGGQNLFHSARAAFGYQVPNYDVVALTQAVCRSRGWKVAQVRFYTGVPDRGDNAHWHHFWAARGRVMRRKGVIVYTRSLKYRYRSVALPDGTDHTVLLGEEKGIEALDQTRLRLPRWSGHSEPARCGPDGLDQDRPRHIRRLPRSGRLPSAKEPEGYYSYLSASTGSSRAARRAGR